jgi:hypothetical protein
VAEITPDPILASDTDDEAEYLEAQAKLLMDFRVFSWFDASGRSRLGKRRRRGCFIQQPRGKMDDTCPGKQPSARKLFGSDRSQDGSFARVVDKIEIHGGFLDAGELFARVVTEQTKYLVLDLDRTVHFGRNLGELLGWELMAYCSYGEDFLERSAATRKGGRFLFDWRRPLKVLRYLLRGARLWFYPGLTYFFGVKVGARLAATRRLIYRWFGPEPVSVLQELPRVALMHHLSELPLDKLRRMSNRLWRLYENDQVILREDIEDLRQRFPKLRIIISSASPQPVMEVASAQLGIEDVVFTVIEESGGFLSSPHFLDRLFLLFRRPKRISPLRSFRQNASFAKIGRLQESFPDLFAPGVESVGVTDTTNGEDHDWANYFTRVVDINSPNPFSPIVVVSSPVKEVHSAMVLTKAERERRAAGAADYLDRRRRKATRSAVKYLGVELKELLASLINALERLAARYHQTYQVIHERRQEFERKLVERGKDIEENIARYNRSEEKARAAALRALRRQLRQAKELRKKITRLELPLSKLRQAIQEHLDGARHCLESAKSIGVCSWDSSAQPFKQRKG